MNRNFTGLFLMLMIPGLMQAQEEILPQSYDNTLASYESLKEETQLTQWMVDNEALAHELTESERASWLKMMENDLVNWAVSALQKSLGKSDLRSLTETIEQQDSLWLYTREGDGIAFDSAGDPVLRSTDPSVLAKDKSEWQKEVQKAGERVMSQWDLNAESVLADIKNRLPEEFRDGVVEKLHVSLKQYRNRVRQESNRFILWSSVHFDSVREDDQYSLRKKSEDETAEALSQRLVDETRFSLLETEKTLNDGISELQDAFVQDASFSIENWDESFQREFQKGLDRWAKAEDSLIAERLDWELRAEEKYIEAEKSWDEAFVKFNDNRKAWIQDIYSQIEEGRKIWDAKEENFGQQFDSIAHEIENAALEQENKFSRQVQSAIELYRESLALLASSDESIKYYQGKIDEITPVYNALNTQRTTLLQKQATNKESLADLCEQLSTNRELLNSGTLNPLEILSISTTIGTLGQKIWTLSLSQSKTNTQLVSVNKEFSLKSEEMNIYKSEISTWEELQASLRSQLTDSKNMLISLESEAKGYDETVPVGTLENEIERVKGVSEYLYSQWLISEAVVDYAEMNSSVRPTEAQTAGSYEDADQNLKSAEQDYQTAISSLAELRTKLGERQISLSESRALMEEARSQMISSQEKYDTSFAIYQSHNPAVIEQMIQDLKNELEIWFDGNSSQSPVRNDLYHSFIQASEYESRQIQEDERQRILRDLKGEEEESEPDLYADISDLESQLESIKRLVPDFENQNSEGWQILLFECGIPSESEDFIKLSSLYNDCFAGSRQIQSKLELSVLLKNLSDSVERKVLTNQKSIEWLKKSTMGDEESTIEIERGLKEEYNNKENNLLYKKAQLLTEIFDGLKSGDYTDKPWKEYADFLMLQDLSEIPMEEGLGSLVDILADLKSGHLDREQAYSSMDESSMSWFFIITGKNTIVPGQNYLDLYLEDEMKDYQDSAAALSSWTEMKACQVLVNEDFKKKNILLDSTSGDEFYEKLGNFNEIEKIIEWYIPLYANEAVPEYFKKTINRYIALNYGHELSGMNDETEAISAELIRIEGQIDKLGISESEIQNSLKSEDSFEIFNEAGFSQELQEWIDYKTLLEWKLYFREARDQAWTEALALAEENETEVVEPEIDKEIIFQSFLSDTARSDIELSELERFDFSNHDLNETAHYSEWSGLSVDDFIADQYPDAGYIEKQFLKIMIEGSKNSLENLWYHISTDLFYKMFEKQKTTNHEYNRVKILQTLKNSERFDENIDRDLDFIKSMIVECGQTMLSDTLPEALESSQSLWQSFQNQQLLSQSNSEKIVKLRTDLNISRKDSEQYKTEVVDVLFQKYQTLEAVFGQSFLDYRKQINLFNDTQQEYLQGQVHLNEAYQIYQQSSVAYQQAEEVLNFAQTGYSPEVANVYTIRDERQKMYERAMASLQVLEGIRDSGKNQAVMDAEWQKYVDASRQLLSLNNNLGYAREELTKDLGQLNREYNTTLGNLTKSAQDLVTFSDGFHFEPEMLNGTLSDLSAWGNSSLDTKFNEYMKDSKTFTKDVVLWMRDMADQSLGSSVLETFSYAYYNELRAMGKSWDEIKSEYGVNLFTTQYHKSLLDCDGSLFQSVNIGYEGDINKYRAGGYENVVKEFYSFNNPQEVYKVYISPEEWLKDKTEQYTKDIKSHSQLTKLYSFYKVLMFNGQFKDQSLKLGMSKDLSVIAWDSLRPEAEHQRNKFKRWFFGGYWDPGDDIDSWIDSLNKSQSSGVRERESVFQNIRSGKAYFASLSSNFQKQNTLTASEGLNTTRLQNLIKMVTGITLDTEQKKLLNQSFNSLSSMEKSSSMVALQCLQKDLAFQKQVSDQKILLRESDLKNDQEIMYTQLLTEYNKDDFDLDVYQTLAKDLYENPSYLEEDYGEVRFGSIWSSDSPSEQDSLYTMTAYGQQLVRSFKSRMSLVKQNRYTQMQEELEGIYNQRQFWEDRIDELSHEGMEQWNLSTQRLIGQRERWRDDFERDYQYKTVLWEGKYKLLARNKNTWIQNSSEAAVSSGTYAMARDMNLDAQSLLGEVNFSLIPDICVETGDLDRIVKDSLDGSTMYKLLAGIQNMTAHAGSHDVILSAHLPSVPDTTKAMDALQEKQLVLKEDISKALALAQACQMKETVDKTRESILDNIDDANKGVDQSVESQLNGAGYARNGSMFTRDVVIDSSLLGGNENELHEIEAYRYFDAPSFDVGVNLDVNFMQNLDSSMIQAGVKLAQERLYNYMNLIFGNEKDDDSTTIRKGLDESFIRYLESQEAAFKGSAQYNTGYEDEEKVWHDTGKHTETNGLFYFHVGYAPEMDEDEPEEVSAPGYGEMGRIYEKFMRQQARLMRGLSSMTMPWYSQKIWDDDANNDGDSDGLIGAPSVRSVADIALTVTGTAMGLGPFPAMMLSMVDDAVFTLADIGNGVMDAGSAALGFLKKAGTSALSFGAGQLTTGLDKLASFEGFGSQFLEVSTDIFNTGINTTINNYGSAALNSLTTGGFDFDSFNSMTSWDAMKMGYISGMAGTAVSSSLELGTFGFIGDTYKDSAKFTSMMGGLTSTGLGYAMTGEAKLNVMNLGGTGVMELNLGGNGSLFNLGMGGTDVSLGSIKSAGRGLNAYSKNREIKKLVEDKRLWAGMRTLYSTAEGSETKSLYNDVISGNAEFNSGTGQSYDGKTTVASGKRMIDLNMDGKSRLDLAVLMSHEAYRDGIDNGAEGQTEETFKAAVGHMQVSSALQSIYGSRTLSGANNNEADMFQKAMDPKSGFSQNDLMEYIGENYDSTQDYWKLTTDGRLLNDNEADLYLSDNEGNYIKDENGDHITLVEAKTGSISQSLIQYIGMDRAAEMLGVNPADLGNYDNQTICDVLGKTRNGLAQEVLNGQTSFESLSLDQQQKMMGELLMKNSGLSWSDDPNKKWTGNDNAEFKITDDWDGYSIGFDQTMTNGEYDKFVVDIVHNRDVLSYLGSTGDQNLKEAYNAKDSSMYLKKNLSGYTKSAFSVDQVQTVDNLWTGDFDKSTAQHPFFGAIQGNTIAANNPFFSIYGQSSLDYDQNVFTSNQATTLSGINLTDMGQDPSISGWSDRWLTHQRTLKESSNSFWGLASDGCIVNTDANMQNINNTLNSWQLYNGFNMGTIINDDWSKLYRSLNEY